MTSGKDGQSSLGRIVFNKEKIMLSSFFLIFLIVPISDRLKGVLWNLAASSIDSWVNTIRKFSLSTSNSLFELVGESIDTFYNFIIEGFDFFKSLVTLDFRIISDKGFILSFIYLILPFIILYSIYEGTKFLGKKRNLFESISVRTLLFVVLLFPFPTNFTWLGALLLILLLFYWIVKSIRVEIEARPGASKIAVVSWKSITFVVLSSLYLLIAVFDTNYNLKLLDILIIPSSIAIVLLIVVIAIISIIWTYSYSKVTNSPISEVIKSKIQEDMTSKRILVGIITIVMLLPIFDQLIIQSTVSPVVFILINLPWILLLILFNPFSFFDQILSITTEGFDRVIDTSREIFKRLIPIKPSEESIIGSIQPSIFTTLIAFGLFLVVIIILKIIKETEESSTEKGMRKNTRTKLYGQAKLLVLAIASFILATIAYIFKPSNFEKIFGNPYEIETRTVVPVILVAIIMTIVGIIASAVVWGILEIKRGRSWRIITSTITINAIAVLVAAAMVTPFVWMLKNSLQTNYQNTLDFQRQGIFPNPFTTQNYAQLFGLVPPPYETLEYRVVTWLFNSIIAAVSVTIFLVIFSSMAGYVLAKREFVGRRLLFTLTIAIQMVPSYVQVIPLYLELNRLNFVGSLLGVILPFLIQPFSIFLCAEFMRSIPDDYLDAARIDGYSEFEIFRKIVLPLSIPVLSVMFIINIIGNWNAFMWPLLLLDQSDLAVQLRTLPLGIYRINAELQEQVGVILALATVIVIPIFVILFLAQDYIKKGVSVEGLKG